MGRKKFAEKAGVSSGSKSGPKPSSSKGKKIETYEDTLEEGGVDDFIFKRDQITFNPQDESDEEDINATQGEDVLSLESLRPRSKRINEDDVDEEDEEDEDVLPLPKQRKEKVKPDVSTKGRFGKPLVDSDDEEEEEESGSGSDSDDDEGGWGRQYYSRPSNRREKEEEGEYDEKREEEREMEVKEVRRLQRKARLGVGRAEDWGLEGLDEGFEGTVDIEAPAADEADETSVPLPLSKDPAVILRHMEVHEPIKLALARDYPLIVHRLEKTARGIKKMMAEGEKDLHKGLGWLHYQTLLTYATTLAFYIHLSTLPIATRPDLSSHPILPRLLQLKEGVAMLEDLDFAAASDSEGDRIELYDGEESEDESDEELKELIRSKKELMARMHIAVNKRGGGDEDNEIEDDDEDEEGDINMEGWAENDDELWDMEGLEDGELEDLMADAENGDSDMDVPEKTTKKVKKGKKASKAIDPPLDEVSLKKKDKKSKKRKATVNTPVPSFTTLTETAFVPSKSRSTKSQTQLDDIDALGDPTSLLEADSVDKETRKRSLKFHTSKIAATSARRNAARAQRLGGDEDLPYRDRKAGRDAALRKNGPKGDGGEDLEDVSPGGVMGKRRDREDEDLEGEGAVAEVEDNGYYDLVKRRKVEKQAEKEAAHDAAQEAHFAQFANDDAEGGPRALTRAIEKNRGLTPRRAKTGRNPRVKKRVAFEKAKRKVASQRAVFKGGQASLGGSYAGEKTGISTKAKSRKF